MTSKGDAGYGTMFSSLLRRPKRGSRRVDIRDLSVSPSSGPPRRRQFTGRTHATADFTEADDDDEDTNEEDLVAFDEDADDVNEEAVEDEEDEDGDADDGADEDNRHRGLPVLPLFSATHLGNFQNYFLFLTSRYLRCCLTVDIPKFLGVLFGLNACWLVPSFITIANRLHSRYPTDIQHHPLHSHNCERSDGDNTIVGPASLSPGLPISGQANATADSNATLFEGHYICIDGKLLAVLQGRTEVCCQCRY